MGVLIKLADDKAGINSDATMRSEQEYLRIKLRRWTIPYELPTGAKIEDATKPVILRDSFTQLADSVEVIPYGNGFVTGLVRAYNQGLHFRLRPEDVWLSILSQLRVRKMWFLFPS
jgi:hypothetical protein